MWQVRIMLKYLILRWKGYFLPGFVCDFYICCLLYFLMCLRISISFFSIVFFSSFKCLFLIYKLKIVRAQIAISGNVRAKAAATEFQRCHQNINVDSFILFKLS